MQSLLNETYAYLNEYKTDKPLYVAFSGGKDSVVLYDIIKRFEIEATFHYNVTSLDAPESIYFIKEYFPDVDFNINHDKNGKPITFWSLVLKNNMFPLRFTRFCCRELKEKNPSNEIIVTGIRQSESIRRRNAEVYSKCYSSNNYRFNPLLYWEDIDIKRYIYQHNLPINPVYAKGFHRVGCLFCPFMNYKDKTKCIFEYPRYFDLLCNIASRLKWKDNLSPEQRVMKWLDDKYNPDQVMLDRW